MDLQNRKILVITSCSFRKLRKESRAINLYQGDFFKKVKKFAQINNFDLKIISAKYGLINPKDVIKPYNKRIRNRKDITKLQEKVLPKLNKIIYNYDKVMLMMGKKYKDVLKPIYSEKFIELFDKRGLGGYKSLMNNLLKIHKNNLYKILFELNENNTITISLIKDLEKNNFQDLQKILLSDKNKTN